MDLSKENLTKLIDLLNENLLKPIDAKLLLKISALLFTGCSIFYVCKIINAYRVFKKLGLKTPDYKFFFGNLPEILENTQSNTLRKWTKKYGKTYGYYEGHLPVMVTSDCEIIQEVFIKQYSNFMARKEYPFQFADDSPKMDLFLSTNKRWKRMRNIINPTFSPAKLKELMPIMKKCANRFLQVLANNENKELVIFDFLNRYTMDTIWNCATGMDIDCQNNPDNLYMSKALLVFKDLEELKFAFRVTSYLSEFRPWILGFVSFFTWTFGKLTHKHEFVDPLFWLTQHIGNIIEARKQQNINKKDFIQLLMETEIDDKEELKRKEKIHLDKFRLDRQMSTEEIKFNLVGFLLAGFETTSTALNYCFYLLAKHPDEMAEVQDELDHYYGSGYAEPDFDNIGDLVYLDMFVHETLRMFPISSNTVNRRCMFPTKLNKMDIPAGLSVTVDVLSLHYDPEYWGPVDPEEFYPLRFSPDNKRHPASNLPFGYGPRNCVGMRFALLEMKLILAKILLKYDVKATANTCSSLSYTEGTVRRPKNKIIIKLEKRTRYN